MANEDHGRVLIVFIAAHPLRTARFVIDDQLVQVSKLKSAPKVDLAELVRSCDQIHTSHFTHREHPEVGIIAMGQQDLPW